MQLKKKKKDRSILKKEDSRKKCMVEQNYNRTVSQRLRKKRAS